MPKKILITHQKGGVGKSTITFNLAQNLSASSKVCVLDLDPQGTLSQLQDVVKEFDIITFQDDISNIDNLEYDFVFIDTPPYLFNNIESLCKISDIILIPTLASVPDLMAIGNTIEIIKSLGKQDDTLVILNKIKSSTSLTNEIKEQLVSYGIQQSETLLNDYVSFSRSMLKKGVSDNKKAQKQIDNLTKEVLKKLLQYA